MGSRDCVADSLKFFLICLVILGHTLSKLSALFATGLAGAGRPGGGYLLILNIIYSFHMPLFVILSGYFTKKSSIEKYLKSIIALFASLIVFEVITLFLKLIIYKTTVPLDRPYWTYWYLLCLIYWRTIVQFFPQIKQSHRWLFLLIASCAGVVAGFMPFGHVLSIQRTFIFLPFFMFGYYLQEEELQHFRNHCKLIPLIALLVCFAIICHLSYQYPELLKMLRGATPYRQMTGNVSSLIILRCITMVLSFVISLSVLSLYRFKFFTSQGEQSLVYYLYHGIIIEFIVIPCCKLLNIECNFNLVLLSFVAAVFLVVSIYLISRISFLYNITNPVKWRFNKVPKKDK